MIRVIMLLSRKEGLSHEEFQQYYESNHAPFFSKLMAQQGCHPKEYSRSYFYADKEMAAGGFDATPLGDKMPAFDVLTQMVFSSQEELDAFFAAYNKLVDQLRPDEKNFINFDRAAVYVADDYFTKV